MLTLASRSDVEMPPQRLIRVMDEPLLAWHRLEATPLNVAYYLRLANGQEQVLWINQRDEEPRVERYIAAIALLPGLTPPLVRADTTCKRLDYPYLLTQYLPSPTLAEVWSSFSQAQRAGAARSWGHTLRRVHRIRFSLAGDLARPEARGRRLLEDLQASWQPLLGTLKGGAVEAARIETLLGRSRDLFTDAPVTLCHGHAVPKNMLWSSTEMRVHASVDFKRAWRSDPMTDLASIWDDVTAFGCQTAFMEGYGALSQWEHTRLAVHRLHHALREHVATSRCNPLEVATWRQRLTRAAAELERLLPNAL